MPAFDLLSRAFELKSKKRDEKSSSKIVRNWVEEL